MLREDDVCRMYIGLYAFFGLMLAVPLGLFALMTIPGLVSAMIGTMRMVVTNGSLPPYNATTVAQWAAFSLVTFGAFLFVHYCLRLARRGGLLPGRQLWICTMVHDISALSWVAWTMDKYDGLPVVIIFAFGWLPYFAMAIWAFLKSNPPKSDAAL